MLTKALWCPVSIYFVLCYLSIKAHIQFSIPGDIVLSIFRLMYVSTLNKLPDFGYFQMWLVAEEHEAQCSNKCPSNIALTLHTSISFPHFLDLYEKSFLSSFAIYLVSQKEEVCPNVLPYPYQLSYILEIFRTYSSSNVTTLAYVKLI